MHSQPPKSPNPLAPLSGGNLCQGDFGHFAGIEVIGEYLLIFLIHYRRDLEIAPTEAVSIYF